MDVEAVKSPIVFADLGKEALRDLLGNLTQAKAFVLEQAPDFCRQLIARDMGLSLFLTLVWFVLCVGSCVVGYQCVKLYHKHHQDDDYAPGAIIGFFLGAFFFSFMCICAYDALYIYLAPKVYLVEQLMKMVK